MATGEKYNTYKKLERTNALNTITDEFIDKYGRDMYDEEKQKEIEKRLEEAQ